MLITIASSNDVSFNVPFHDFLLNVYLLGIAQWHTEQHTELIYFNSLPGLFTFRVIVGNNRALLNNVHFYVSPTSSCHNKANRPSPP